MPRVVTYSAIAAGAVADPGIWSADCASYRINDTQGIRARWGLMTGGIDPRWPFANCDGSVETQGPSAGVSQSLSATSESGVAGPDAVVRFGKTTDPDDPAKTCFVMRWKQGDDTGTKRTELSFSPTTGFSPIPLGGVCWLACSMRLPSAWKSADSNDETMIFQVHESPDAGDDTQPAPIGMVVTGRVQRLWVRSNPNATTLQAATVYNEVWRESEYPADQWQHWVFKLKSHWDASQSPRLEAWRALGSSGALVKMIDYSAPNTYNNTNRDFAKHGNYYYANLWTGGLTERVMHSKGLYQWLDGQGLTPELIVQHLRSI